MQHKLSNKQANLLLMIAEMRCQTAQASKLSETVYMILRLLIQTGTAVLTILATPLPVHTMHCQIRTSNTARLRGSCVYTEKSMFKSILIRAYCTV